MKSRLLPILALALHCACPATAREQQSFPIQWKVGKSYVQQMVMAQQMSLPGQGEIQTEMTMELSAVPKKGSEAGTTEVTMTYDKAGMTMKMGGQEMPGAGDALKKFVGQSITTVVDAEGKITDIKGMEKLVGDDPMLAQMMSKDSMKQMMAQASLMAAPDRPVGPGDSWEFSVEYPMPMMKMTLQGKYTYEKDEVVDGSACARLVLEGRVTMDTETGTGKKEGADAQADQTRDLLKSMGFKINESAMTGVTHYDFSLGHLARSEMDMSLTMSMKDPQTQKEMTMPMKTKVTQTLKVIDAK